MRPCDFRWSEMMIFWYKRPRIFCAYLRGIYDFTRVIRSIVLYQNIIISLHRKSQGLTVNVLIYYYIKFQMLDARAFYCPLYHSFYTCM